MRAAEMKKGKGRPRRACAGVRTNGPVTRGAVRAGLAQRAGSGRIGLGQQRAAGERRSPRIVMQRRRGVCRSGAELGCEIRGRAAAETIAAARNIFVVLMLVTGWPGVMGVLFRTGLGVRGAQMKRGMGVAGCQRKRQQHDQATQKQGSLHRIEHVSPMGLRTSPIPA
jgi:hypothetical protein